MKGEEDSDAHFTRDGITIDHCHVQNNEDSWHYPFEDYERSEEQYTRDLALLHKECIEYFSLGFFSSLNFRPKTVEDVTQTTCMPCRGFTMEFTRLTHMNLTRIHTYKTRHY
jgi:hypothetical protein